MAADLHIHTTFSDGCETPEEVVAKAKEAKLSAIAITDHDNVEGIKSAQAAGEKLGIKVIPGIEFTTEVPEAEIHILGYFVNDKDPKLRAVLEKIQGSRHSRIFMILEKLKKIGVNLDPDKVFAFSKGASAGRPHVARALVEAGVVKSIRSAFDKYLGWQGPAYVPHYKLTPEGAVKLILENGGIPVYAHPLVSDHDKIIPELVSFGLKGIEVFYPGHSDEQRAYYLALAKKLGLLVTGGSDYHGAANPREGRLGEVYLPDEYMEKLFEARSSLTS